MTFTFYVDAGLDTGVCSFVYGDGVTNTGGCQDGRTATRSYSSNGTYDVRMTEYTSDGVDDEIACGTVVVD